MGEVYRAFDSRLEREVAVKVLHTRFANDEAARVRFEREAKAIAALSHPNILAIFDFGIDRACRIGHRTARGRDPARASRRRDDRVGRGPQSRRSDCNEARTPAMPVSLGASVPR